MTLMHEIFLTIFIFLFELLRQPLVTYLIILAIFGLLAWANFKQIKKLSGKSNLILRLILMGVEVFLAAYIIWFLLIHFSTFTMMS